MSSMYDDTGTHTTGHHTTGYDEPMTGPLDAPEGQGGWHPVNITHLVMGVAFAGIALVWALSISGVVGGEHDRWLWPVPWLAAGAAGLTATVWTSRK